MVNKIDISRANTELQDLISRLEVDAECMRLCPAGRS